MAVYVIVTDKAVFSNHLVFWAFMRNFGDEALGGLTKIVSCEKGINVPNSGHGTDTFDNAAAGHGCAGI